MIVTNLKKAFPAYRLKWDDSDDSSHRDPWCMELHGKYGKVYPLGENGDLGAMLFAGHGKLKARLATLGSIWQEGDQEIVVRFPVAKAKPVLDLLKIRRKRVMSAEAREAAGKRLSEARLKAA